MSEFEVFICNRSALDDDVYRGMRTQYLPISPDDERSQFGRRRRYTFRSTCHYKKPLVDQLEIQKGSERSENVGSTLLAALSLYIYIYIHLSLNRLAVIGTCQ